MTSCRQMRDAIVATVRRQASDADRLRLEQHLSVCAACRAEKARWLLMEQLGEQAPQRLPSDARARVLCHLTSLPEQEDAVGGKARRFLPLLLASTATVGVAFVLLAVRGRHDSAIGAAGRDDAHRPRQMSVGEERAITVQAQMAGAIDSAGAHIAYPANASFSVQPGGRQVDLYAGEIDVDVAPGGAGRFRVLAPHFTVEVLGTHFLVGLDRVETLHGIVRVVEPSGQELAVVSAGQTWRLHDMRESSDTHARQTRESLPGAALAAHPAPGCPPAGPVVSRNAARTRRVASVAGADSFAAVARPVGSERIPASRAAAEQAIETTYPSADQLLAEARTVLAGGDTQRTRECIAGALDARPTTRQRAMAELLSADTLLVESRYDEALAAYRRTVNRFGEYPEGETAAFALAQLLCERGPPAEARVALDRYLARYPTGRFVEEAGKKLAKTPAP